MKYEKEKEKKKPCFPLARHTLYFEVFPVPSYGSSHSYLLHPLEIKGHCFSRETQQKRLTRTVPLSTNMWLFPGDEPEPGHNQSHHESEEEDKSMQILALVGASTPSTAHVWFFFSRLSPYS